MLNALCLAERLGAHALTPTPCPAGATATLARCQRLSHGLEGLLVGLLLGLHRPETGPDGNWE